MKEKTVEPLELYSRVTAEPAKELLRRRLLENNKPLRRALSPRLNRK